MRIDRTTRLVVIGNSGSGKSTLSEHIARIAGLEVHDLDLTHWLDIGGKRDKDEAKALVRALAADDAWVIEGVYGWLAEAALPRATALIWTDLPWSECRDGLFRRGLRRGMTENDQLALIAWAEAYDARSTSSSRTGHRALFDAFVGERVRLESRGAVSEFVAAMRERELGSTPEHPPARDLGDP